MQRRRICTADRQRFLRHDRRREIQRRKAESHAPQLLLRLRGERARRQEVLPYRKYRRLPIPLVLDEV